MGGRCDERRVSTSLSIPPRKVRCAEQRMREPGAPVSASSAFVPFLLRAPVPKKTGRCQRGVKILSTCHFFDLSFLLTGVEAAMLVNRGGGGGAVAPHLFRGPPPPRCPEGSPGGSVVPDSSLLLLHRRRGGAPASSPLPSGSASALAGQWVRPPPPSSAEHSLEYSSAE